MTTHFIVITNKLVDEQHIKILASRKQKRPSLVLL